LGILKRYVVGEVTRAFSLALLTMTAIFVLFMIAAQARDIGLSPSDIVHLVPFVIPSTLPYTIPVSLLFAATVVYGRLAGDNEIIAVKSAGVSVWHVLTPTLLLGSALGGWLLYASSSWIPQCNNHAKMVLFHDLEDMFYKLLARDREFNHRKWSFLIKVRDVQDSKMIDATFMHKIKGTNDYDAVIQASEATLHFDLKAMLARIYLKNSEIQRFARDADVMLINGDTLEMPIPSDSQLNSEKKIQEFTNEEIGVELAKHRELIRTVRAREAITASMAIASGRMDTIDWDKVDSAFRDYGDWIRRCNEFETERHLRLSMALGSFLFVLLGAPVGIRFAKRDFLSAFMTCFLPIIGLYYPLMLFGTNISKEGIMPPLASLWIGNVLLSLLAMLVLPSVVKH
jgi:lipopolysaccharide export system permease protein